jgi:hypothetical protein
MIFFGQNRPLENGKQAKEQFFLLTKEIFTLHVHGDIPTM